ncbi:hypothetical protein CEXT_570661 [Caerostris extrusa]|uniref:Uncharacterized protein n=1 Tax=Caerostris extrusa TaxID=172846 RepID=A0AAV4Y794_CAEEX|nr:hypothetical protein CEXT_570661 [Caerostris extrusa]
MLMKSCFWQQKFPRRIPKAKLITAEDKVREEAKGIFLDVWQKFPKAKLISGEDKASEEATSGCERHLPRCSGNKWSDGFSLISLFKSLSPAKMR